MPDQTGKLTANEKSQILAWAQRVAPNGFMCPISGHLDPQWGLQDFIVAPLKITSKGDAMGVGAMPLQFYFVNTKGCVLYFSAVVARIVLDFDQGAAATPV